MKATKATIQGANRRGGRAGREVITRFRGFPGHPILVWLALCAALAQGSRLFAVPPIEIDLLTPALVEVSWPETDGVVQLELSNELRFWLPVPSPPSLLDGRRRILATTAPGEGFFRLRGNAGLYVVNQQEDFIGFSNFETAEGNVAPTSRLSRGLATGLTQPRAAVVTSGGRLLLSRGNGGIVGWNNATEAIGNTPHDLEVNGGSTGLDSPISFAYDRDEDRLFVGTVQSALGIIVFDDVSSAGFNGNIPPDRSFGSGDRFPHATVGTIRMTIDAFKLDGGNLYVVDTSGLSQNSSRILAFENPSAASGMTNPARIISGPWSVLRNIEIVGDRLFAVDDSNVIFIVDNIDNASGVVQPKQVTVVGDGVHLRAVIAFDRQLYFLDENNAAILVLADIPDGNDASVAPDRVIEGSATRLRLPSYMHISRGFLEPQE